MDPRRRSKDISMPENLPERGDGPIQFPDSRYLSDPNDVRQRMKNGRGNSKYHKVLAAVGAMMVAAAALSGTFKP